MEKYKELYDCIDSDLCAYHAHAKVNRNYSDIHRLVINCSAKNIVAVIHVMCVRHGWKMGGVYNYGDGVQYVTMTYNTIQ